MSKKPRAGGKRRIALCAVLAAAVLLMATVAIYARSYSRADDVAQDAMLRAEAREGMYAFGDAASKTGLLLYPGGKVEYTAYAPLAERIAATAGVLVVVPKMPLNLAVLDMGAANRVMAAFPAVNAWYVGGHSLGGAMASQYAAASPDAVAGVVLLAAYATEPLPVRVLSVYGDSDTVLDRGKYEAARAYLPEAFTEVAIAGGNHARFGNYGVQKGDSAAAISATEQQRITAEAIAGWLATPSA